MELQIRYAIIEVKDTNLGKMHHHIRIDGRKVEQIFCGQASINQALKIFLHSMY